MLSRRQFLGWSVATALSLLNTRAEADQSYLEKLVRRNFPDAKLRNIVYDPGAERYKAVMDSEIQDLKGIFVRDMAHQLLYLHQPDYADKPIEVKKELINSLIHKQARSLKNVCSFTLDEMIKKDFASYVRIRGQLGEKKRSDLFITDTIYQPYLYNPIDREKEPPTLFAKTDKVQAGWLAGDIEHANQSYHGIKIGNMVIDYDKELDIHINNFFIIKISMIALSRMKKLKSFDDKKCDIVASGEGSYLANYLRNASAKTDRFSDMEAMHIYTKWMDSQQISQENLKSAYDSFLKKHKLARYGPRA